jgi:hypothetical protein
MVIVIGDDAIGDRVRSGESRRGVLIVVVCCEERRKERTPLARRKSKMTS